MCVHEQRLVEHELHIFSHVYDFQNEFWSIILSNLQIAQFKVTQNENDTHRKRRNKSIFWLVVYKYE